MLNNETRAELLTLAMEAEMECYNPYFMERLTKRLIEIISENSSKSVWNFLINASDCTYRLYLEFCLRLPEYRKISYKL